MSATKKRSRVLRNGRSKIGDQFVPIPYNMVDSVAWRSLKGSTVRIYIELAAKFNGHNNGAIVLSMEEAAGRLHMSKSTVHAGLGEREEKGFIKLAKLGRFYGRMASEYVLTAQALQGHHATNDWKNWRPLKLIPRYSNRTITQSDGSVSVPVSAIFTPPNRHNYYGFRVARALP